MAWVIMLLIVLPFGFVLLYGAPYLPTRKRPANMALDMLKLKKGDVFVDPGCGDGAVIIEAAKRGLTSVTVMNSTHLFVLLRSGEQENIKKVFIYIVEIFGT
jgi:hypothetical protein